MIIEYAEIPEDSKVWIYPSSRKFYQNEIEDLESKIKTFLSDWKQDGQAIESSFVLKYNRFIVVFTSSNTPVLTNSVNELVAFIIGLQNEYSIELLDKMNACFKQGEHVQYKDLKAFKQLIKDKGVNKNTIVFDNLITTKSEFEEYWEVPAHESWYGNIFK